VSWKYSVPRISSYSLSNVPPVTNSRMAMAQKATALAGIRRRLDLRFPPAAPPHEVREVREKAA
jgi:hypothetical protein